MTAVEATLAHYKGKVACIIVEPVVDNARCIPPNPGYLQALRTITAREGEVLILDEVMMGFRLAPGGVQELDDIQPDMTCLGKILGGGMPCGAFSGRAEIMRLLAPLGPVYQAGTLSSNPLAMAAGIATVRTLMEHRETVYRKLEKTSASVVEGVANLAMEAGISLTTNRVGSMFTWFFSKGAVTDYESVLRSDTARFAAFHRFMMESGVWLPPSQFEAAFLSMAHGEEEVRATLVAAREAMAAVAKMPSAGEGCNRIVAAWCRSPGPATTAVRII